MGRGTAFHPAYSRCERCSQFEWQAEKPGGVTYTIPLRPKMVFEFRVQAGKQSRLSVNLHVLAARLSGPCADLTQPQATGSCTLNLTGSR